MSIETAHEYRDFIMSTPLFEGSFFQNEACCPVHITLYTIVQENSYELVETRERVAILDALPHVGVIYTS